MAPALPRYTPYRDVNIILHRLRSDAESILGEQWVGMYLYGSLSLGDFNPQTSDVDFLVVTKDDLTPETITALQAMHRRLAESNLPFATQLEGSYIPQSALRQHDPDHSHHPYLNSHDNHDEQGVVLRVEDHGSDWDIQRHIVREHGVVIAGPSPKTLIDPITPRTIQNGVKVLLYGWWQEMLNSPLLEQADYQAFAILTMCRMLYTFEHGTVVSKPVAAQWALSSLEPRWAWLIEWAVAYPNLPPRDPAEAVRDFIRYTRGKSKEK
jgi:predicted nucleotidyltransferase